MATLNITMTNIPIMEKHLSWRRISDHKLPWQPGITEPFVINGKTVYTRSAPVICTSSLLTHPSTDHISAIVTPGYHSNRVVLSAGEVFVEEEAEPGENGHAHANLDPQVLVRLIHTLQVPETNNISFNNRDDRQYS